MLAVKEILSKYFGYNEFRVGQQEIIADILNNNDLVGVMPTGAGKSICYQVPALIKSGITIVVSPLISLMKDQVQSLISVGIPAAYINSSLTPGQIEKAMYNAKIGKYKIIYVAPERLLTGYFLAFAKSCNISMLTVDEAHCISQWGQDFRPSYREIPEFVNALENRPPVSAFTATATAKVRQDIIELLQLKDPKVYVTGFNRENLYFEVQSPRDKFASVKRFLTDNPSVSGIIYCSTRKGVEELCDKLNSTDFSATRYHAGLSDEERHNNQNDFLYDRVSYMVATNAFGMGIDKSNVSFVIHYNMPKDLESYYQEAGRAGRDGSNAKCLLLYSGQDYKTNEWMIRNDKDKVFPDPETEENVKQLALNRLREMTYYSTTTDCLRGYILRYFGESPANYCGSCGSCNANFQDEDITTDAKQILTCVSKTGERFGIATIIEVLKGSKNSRIERFGLTKISCYGTNKRSTATLHIIVRWLIREGYLNQTTDEYPVLKLSEGSNEVLYDEKELTMKLSKERITRPKGTKSIATNLPADREGLLIKLKALRYKLASAQSVPAFVVFTDNTLIDMCSKLPQTDSEFLDISGVGEEKLKRYSAAFIEEIADYLNDSNKKQ